MATKNFQWLYDHVLQRLNDERVLESLLPMVKNASELCAQTDNYYLSTMSRRIFRAGLKHSLVDAKWPAFERVFFDFNVQRVAMMSWMG